MSKRIKEECSHSRRERELDAITVKIQQQIRDRQNKLASQRVRQIKKQIREQIRSST